MAINTPGTNRYSRFLGGTHMNGRWYCSCNIETRFVATGSGPNAGKDFFKCTQDPMCGFWLWTEHEAEAQRVLAARSSLEPQTPSKPPQPRVEWRSEPTPTASVKSSVPSLSHSTTSDRVLRSARQATPSSSQLYRSQVRPRTPEDNDSEEEELAVRVAELLESFHIQLSARQKRKLYVLIDDYVEEMERDGESGKGQVAWLKREREDRDGYVVG